MTTTYADYTYYTATYGGSIIASQTAFDRLAKLASLHIDRLTFGRAEDVTDEDDTAAIKNAVCLIADELYDIETSGSDGIQSERAGVHQVTYKDSALKSKSKQERIREAARTYLDSTTLMYAGFYDGEYGTVVEDGV